jgi:hypothetical protein
MPSGCLDPGRRTARRFAGSSYEASTRGGGRPWLSPETLENPLRASRSSDVYMLGGVMHEVLTGKCVRARRRGRRCCERLVNVGVHVAVGLLYMLCSGGLYPFFWARSKDDAIAIRGRHGAASAVEVRARVCVVWAPSGVH